MTGIMEFGKRLENGSYDGLLARFKKKVNCKPCLKFR